MEDREQVALSVLDEAPAGLRAVTEGEVNQQIATAKRFPRNLKAVYGEVLTLATGDEETAESCFYSVPRGGKQIEGPSIRMAEILASSWGNMRVASRIVAEDGGSVTCEGLAWDLEKNVCISAQAARKLHGKKDRRTGERLPPDADEIALAKMSGQAIARRNAILQVIPGAWIKTVMSEVRKVAIGKADTLPNRREKVLDYLAKMGVQRDRVLRLLGAESVDAIDGEGVLTLRGIAQRIKDGETTVDEAFAVSDRKARELDEKLAPPKPPAKPKAPVAGKFEDWQDAIAQADAPERLKEYEAAIEADPKLSDDQKDELAGALAKRARALR
jgi:hypothetical protein